MSESTTTIFLIAGATRGIGLAFVADVAAKYPSAIIYAGARDPSGPGIAALKNIAEKYPSQVEIIKYVAADEEGNKAIAQLVKERHGRVDVVIANAAILSGMAPIHEIDIAQYKDHFNVNFLGPLVLFKAFYHLLKASSNPKFVPMTSIGGSFAAIPQMPAHGACYSTSKVMLNWLARKIHFENEWLVCFPLSPGGVDTEMLTYVVSNDVTGTIAGFIEKAGSQSPAAAADSLIDIIMAATRETEGGQFVNVDGSRMPW